MTRTSEKSHQSIRFKIAPAPNWVKRGVARSKYDDVIDAALRLKDKSVIRVWLDGMKFNSLSTALRVRMSQRKLSKKIHVEQNKQAKEIVIVKGPCPFKGRRRGYTSRQV